MAYKNISGTTLPTFKLRNGQIELISAVLTKENGEKVSKFKVRDSSGAIRSVAYTEDIDSIKDHIDELYDTVIKSESIRSMSYITDTDGTKKVVIKVLNETGGLDIIDFPAGAKASDIETPDETLDGEIVLYGSTDGKTLKNSNLTIANTVDELLNENRNTIPTSKAVREYIGNASSALGERVAGKGVTDYGQVLPD